MYLCIHVCVCANVCLYVCLYKHMRIERETRLKDSDVVWALKIEWGCKQKWDFGGLKSAL